MSSSLEERLKSNSSAFDGLLSLIPAKYYYDDDTQDQWKAKKKTKEEARQIKRAKLDPSSSQDNNNSASASQVLQKKAKTAKPVVIPGERNNLKKPVQEEQRDTESSSESEEESEEETTTPSEKETKVNNSSEQDDEEEDINFVFDDDGNEVDLNKQEESKQQSTKSKKKQLTEEEKLKKEESIKQLRDKLSNKIKLLKEKRKAPGTSVQGAPISREAILEERRKKTEAKAELKKRKLAELNKDDDSEVEEEDEEDSLSEDSDNEQVANNNVMYQNIEFDSDTKASSDLQNIRHNVKKGPAKRDIKAHLKIIESKKKQLLNHDETKQKELQEKDKWNKVMSIAQGEKLRDDEKLLKKALKRKEAQKRKSEIQWNDRKDHVQNMISAKAKRREENLQIRKNNKGLKTKHQQKQIRKFKTNIAPKRPGFEGRIRSGKKK